MRLRNPFKRKRHGRKIFLIIGLFLAFAVFVPYFLRAAKHGGLMPGDEPYYHARIAEQIAQSGIPEKDMMAFGGRDYTINPYHLALAGMSYAFGAALSSKLLSAAAGIASAILFYLILKQLNFSLIQRLSSAVVLILSPIFINISSVPSPFSLMILLDLAGFYIYIRRKKASSAVSAVIFAIASLFSFTNLIFVLLVLFAYSQIEEKNRKRLARVIFLMALALLFYYIPLYFQQGFPAYYEFQGNGLLKPFVSDLGGDFGFSVFALLLAGVGLAYTWKKKKSLYPAYLLMIFLIIYSFFANYAAVYSNFVIAILAGIAFSYFARMKWKLKEIRNLSLLLLFCGILFSAVSYSIRLGDSQPSQGLADALEWIQENSDEEDVVFSHYTKGFWVQSIAGRKVLMDSLLQHSPKVQEYYNDSKIIFDTYDIRETRKLLEKHEARFILITADMDDGLVWSKPGQGLAFLLSNSETFKKTYSNPEADVYEYIYRGQDES